MNPRSRRLAGILLVALSTLVLAGREHLGSAFGVQRCGMACCAEETQEPSCCESQVVVPKIVDPCGCDEGQGMHLASAHLSWWLPHEEDAPQPRLDAPRAPLHSRYAAGRRAGPEPRPPRTRPT